MFLTFCSFCLTAFYCTAAVMGEQLAHNYALWYALAILALYALHTFYMRYKYPND